MSLPHGTYLGGIRTIKDLRDRCRINHETDCWHWSMGKDKGIPKVHFVLKGKRHNTKGRRAAVMLKTGGTLPPGTMVWPSCETLDCVNPAHTEQGTKAEHIRTVVAPKLKQNPKLILWSRAYAREHRAKINMDQAREIRGSIEKTGALCKRYGLAASVVRAIRRGDSWRETLMNASVFGLR